MNRIALAAAAALTATAALAGAASAQTNNTGDAARKALSQIAPNADVASLSNAEAVAAWQVVSDQGSAAKAKFQAEALIRNFNS
ncbi:hypothetical protein Q4543_23110 [Salipiger sp. 1_MG-2023]|uniref:hypothetical protein n=1 Tax=Salipiger sp. 1_MG-2023 TaxID=3062665 RepID=UPI0026E2A96A|nr:hypothetical protein [Salipiger sp. 1_MG-2023]MDO6588383.1 hypothetical protein [Salipiger sp. 1_MG-2023]